MYTATASAKTGHMTKVLLTVFAFAVVCSIAPTASALDQMGPPVAGLEQGQFKVGADFSYSEMDLETDDGDWVEFLDGFFFDAGEATSFTLKDFEASKTFVNFGYGFVDNVEGFFRIGGTRGEFGDSIWEDSEEFESGSNLVVGGGIKATFIEQGGLKVGGIIQGSYAEYQGELDAPHWAGPDFVEVDLTEVQIALGASYTWAESFSIYGGPFLHFVSGNLYDNVTELFVDQFGVPGILNSEYTWELDEDSAFGGYIGAQFEIGEGCAVNVEYQKTAAADAFGASILWRF
ncbi:MAG: hypothetical protein ACYSWQ_21695 [Planctomycetota bacterium]|jgi:hypothetical protein